MATMTLAQVYGPWSGLGEEWAQEDQSWAQMAVSWEDQAVTWAEALQPWAAAISSPPIRIFNVPAESRVVAVHSEQRILSVAPQS